MYIKYKRLRRKKILSEKKFFFIIILVVNVSEKKFQLFLGQRRAESCHFASDRGSFGYGSLHRHFSGSGDRSRELQKAKVLLRYTARHKKTFPGR